jgi:hypothetical protein
MVCMEANKDFALLVGRAFLRELENGHRSEAIAFGRALLLALGRKGPEEEREPVAHHRVHGDSLVLAEN